MKKASERMSASEFLRLVHCPLASCSWQMPSMMTPTRARGRIVVGRSPSAMMGEAHCTSVLLPSGRMYALDHLRGTSHTSLEGRTSRKSKRHHTRCVSPSAARKPEPERRRLVRASQKPLVGSTKSTAGTSKKRKVVEAPAVKVTPSRETATWASDEEPKVGAVHRTNDWKGSYVKVAGTVLTSPEGVVNRHMGPRAHTPAAPPRASAVHEGVGMKAISVCATENSGLAPAKRPLSKYTVSWGRTALERDPREGTLDSGGVGL
mmetsp:Transcript_13413/g.32965  ORF Transcript_13413/g.32965 Transcript_13413/m.32965 type:complete len:263 (+) Transcript_13413:2792-3580(+)